MAWKDYQYRLTSLSPMIHHKPTLADPTSALSKAMKQITSKRKKTDADYEEMAHIEFVAGLYISKDGPICPIDYINGVLVSAAKKQREGQNAKSACFCTKHALLEYDGPKTVDELWADERFRDTRLVKVQQARVMRTRPIFNEWSCVVTIAVEDEIINPSRLEDWMRIGGVQIGLGDYRPSYGRFTATKM